jgi:hypothetical protein
MTAEEEAEWIARAMHNANVTNAGPLPEVTPTPEQQYQQVADTMAAANLTNNAGYQAQQAEQMGLFQAMGGQPLQFGAGPPYAESTSNWHDFNSNNTTTGGGFFNFEELFQRLGKMAPQAFQSGSNMPSTNNYRLLPPDFRKPNYIMRNGQIIDMSGPTMKGPWGTSDSMGEDAPSWRSGAGVGMPVAFARSPIDNAISGWPGAFGFQLHSMGGN